MVDPITLMGVAAAMLGFAFSAAKRDYINSFTIDVLDRRRQGEWFNVKPISLLNKLKAYQVVQMMPYRSDLEQYGKVEYFGKASETLMNGGGDCDCKAIMLSSFWLGLGLKPSVILAETSRGGHSFVELDGEVYDPTWDFWKEPREEYYSRFKVNPYLWYDDKFYGGYD